MKKILLPILSIVTLMAVSYHASAASFAPVTATFDFASVADGTVPGQTYGADNGEYGASSMIFTSNGIAVTATSQVRNQSSHNDHDRDGDEHNGGFAYLDRGDAGLGVCKHLHNTQCSPSSDDNVTFGEILQLTFDQEVSLNTVFFKNAGHGTTFGGDFKLSVDAGDWDTLSLAYEFDANRIGTTFEFYNFNGGSGAEFYINKLSVNAVPIPAAIWLFGTGLLGMVAVARRKA